MSKKTKVSGSAQEMETAYRASTNPHDQKRLLALQMAQQGVWVLSDIGRALIKSRSTIGRWLKSYREEGMAGMLKRGHGGRKPQLQQDDVEALEEVLGEGKYKTAMLMTSLKRPIMAAEKGPEIADGIPHLDDLNPASFPHLQSTLSSSPEVCNCLLEY